MGIVDRYSRENFADAIYGYVRRDECKMASALLKIVEWEDEPDRRALERDLLEFMEAHLYRPLKEVRLRNLLQDLLLLLSKHKLFLSPDIYLMIKAFSEVEGIGLMLDPDFDMAEIAAPFIKKIKLSKITPSRLLANLADSGEEFVTALSTLPGHLSDFLKLAKQGKVRVVFEHRGLENLVYELDRSTNRLAFALIISALIIGSSFIMTTNVGPFIFGFPIMGVFGYSIAGIFGVWLIISIFRSGKL